MRLIDADALLQRLQAWNTEDSMDKAHYNFTWVRIMEQPTAYDVERVVEEINEESWEYMSDFPNSSVIGRDDAIYVVKRGGVDD